MSKPTMFFGCSLAIFLMLFPANTISQTYSFTSVDVPGAQGTACTGINTAGNVVGYYVDDNDLEHGFLLKSSGFAFIDSPGARETFAYGVNDFDQVVGWYVDTSGVAHGFEASAPRRFTTIDYPDESGTNLWSITNVGEIVGSYRDTSGLLHGFTDNQGTFATVRVGRSPQSEVHGFNKQSYLVGVAYDHSGNAHGFHGFYEGPFYVFNFPGAGWTEANRINDEGEIVGAYAESQSGPFSGYTYAGGVFTTIMFPSSTDTEVLGLNNAGIIVGQYTDTSGVIHGFMGTPQP